MAATAIWRDTVLTASTTASPLNFTISIVSGPTSEPVFYGTAYARPASSAIEIKAAPLCRDWLSSDFPELTGATGNTWLHSGACREFVFTNTDRETILGRYEMVLDCSYDASVNYSANTTMSRPVNGHWAPGMRSMVTEWNAADGAVRTTVRPGAYGPYSDHGSCRANYALYYLNRYGGWDGFLFEGNCSRTDKFNRLYMTKPYSSEGTGHGRLPYLNSITPSWSLGTGWLTDTESRNLAFNLFSSNMVYLHDLVEDRIYPAAIDDTQVQWRDWQSQRKLAEYTVQISAANAQEIL